MPRDPSPSADPDGRSEPPDVPDSPLFPTRIDTDRIAFRPAAPETVDPFELYAYTNPDAPDVEEITRYLPWDPNPTPKAALDHLQGSAAGFREGETADYLVVPTAPDVLADAPDDGPDWAGKTTLHLDWDRRSAEWGIWLRKPFWGHGLATECGAAMLALAFDRLDLELVRIQHEVGNDASRGMIENVVDRYGGRHEGLLRNQKASPDGPRDLHRFTVSQSEYRDATDGGLAIDPVEDPLAVDPDGSSDGGDPR